jgi:DNA/RNA-binding domain of Phe-tRNA-synthetase-like protein
VLTVDSRPPLALGAFESRLPRPLGAMSTTATIAALLATPAGNAGARLSRDEEVRKAVRDLLRFGGYKPTGRGKPASEYLVKAAGEDGLDGINLVVDACNAVSLHSGLPISVVDLERVEPPLGVGIVEGDQRYVFNATGQEIRLEGLLCMRDAIGPCANAVKDSQRTKTHDGTTRTLSLVWGPEAFAERVETATFWYREILAEAGATTHDVDTTPDDAASS